MRTQSRLVVRVSFGGNGLDAGDPEEAAKELSNQGYKVHRLPRSIARASQVNATT